MLVVRDAHELIILFGQTPTDQWTRVEHLYV